MKKRLIIESSILIIILSIFVTLNCFINKRNDEINSIFESTDEFVQTIDCTPYFDAGDSKQFIIEFDLKTDKEGTVSVSIYDSKGFKYWFPEQKIESTTVFTHYKIKCSPYLTDNNMPTSMLSFHGGYGTGVCPHVKNIVIEECK